MLKKKRNIVIYGRVLRGDSELFLAEYDSERSLAYGFLVRGGNDSNAYWGYMSNVRRQDLANQGTAGGLSQWPQRASDVERIVRAVNSQGRYL